MGDDGTDPVLRQYAPKWSREWPRATDVQRQQYVNLSKDEYHDRRIRSLRPEPVPEPPAQENGLLAQMGRMALVAGVAAGVALLGVYWETLFERASSLNLNPQNKQNAKIPDPQTQNRRTANSVVIPA